MSNLKEIFQKQGGLKLIRQYWKSGALFTAAGQFCLLGKSRTALEILRLSTQLKARKKLEKRYLNVLKEFDSSYTENCPHESSNKVWVCWFQGMEQAPELVKKCYESMKKNLIHREIVLITADNMTDYVEFPEYIMKKWKEGQISHTHMTDLLRLELLIRHGGMWLDATVLCTRKEEEIPDYYFQSDLFYYQCLKPGRDGHSHYNSSWLMSAKTNNKMLMAVRHLCYEYWKENQELIDYFLLHDFMAIVMEFYPKEWLKIVPCDNATPHILYLRLFEQYDPLIWEAVKNQTPFHKLSYKFKAGQEELDGTYYKAILK